MVKAVAGGLAVDGLNPEAIWEPRSAQEVAEDLAAANAAGKALIPVGGGRLLGLGNPPSRYQVALRMTALNSVLDHSEHDLTVTVQAGIAIEALQEHLQKAGQFLPLDPLAGPGHTIGGALASGISGPLRLRYGSARDYVIGLRVALPDGRLVRSGGKVVKNVSGYDMNKLHLGALGSLGVIVEASFKVFPLPKATASVALELDDFGVAWREARRALELPQRPAALELGHGAQADWTLRARFFGEQRAIDRMARELGWQAMPDWHWTANVGPAPGEQWLRIAVDPAALPGILAGLPPGGSLRAQPGVGIVDWFGAADPHPVAGLRRLAGNHGGSLVVVAAEDGFKRAVGAWGSPPPAAGLMRALRDAFDPQRTISPGRYMV